MRQQMGDTGGEWVFRDGKPACDDTEDVAQGMCASNHRQVIHGAPERVPPRQRHDCGLPTVHAAQRGGDSCGHACQLSARRNGACGLWLGQGKRMTRQDTGNRMHRSKPRSSCTSTGTNMPTQTHDASNSDGRTSRMGASTLRVTDMYCPFWHRT